ncbi:hypothetical protein HU200_064361 [Digitaria exilis]|uniref:SNF2 N-terminal domain-containing protein n=1 Tax=Digitaria exilis TaxID=1010633 RepID=A0A835DUK5_9POAL|nr:hypothetical protein HU200_064361 [Digitaria exilis]
MLDSEGFISVRQASSYSPAQNILATENMSKLRRKGLPRLPVPSMTSVIDFEADNIRENPDKNHFSVGEKAVYEEALQVICLISQEKGEEDLPEGVLSVSLLKHQGLGKTISTIALIQKERLQQSRFMTNNSERDISADEDDGAVLVTGKKERQAHASQSRVLKAQPKKKTRGSSPTSTLRPTSRPAAGTLVLCPASVLKQWANELSAKVNKSAELSVLVYRGGSRTRDPTDLADYDFILQGRSKEYMQKNYVHILALLSQLRQACNHPFLLKGKQSFDHSLGMAKQLPVEIATNVLENIERGAAKCTITKCRVSKQLPWNNFYLTYSRDCVHKKKIDKCPASPHCGEKISPESLLLAYALKFVLWPKLESDATTSCSTDEDRPFSVCESSYISSKIRATIDILNSIINTGDDHDAIGSVPSEIAPTKAIVFTQWTGMLDLLEHSLGSNHIEFRRLDGSMPLDVRERGVKEFNTDPEVLFQTGSNVFASFWQEGKRKMIQSALGEDQSGDNAATRLTVEDLRYLFKI